MPLSARERLKAEVENMLLAGTVRGKLRPDGGAAHIPVALTKESNESTTKGADVTEVADRAAPEAISEADAAAPAETLEGASILIDVSDAAEPPLDVSEDTPRSTFNDAKEGALRSKLRNQGSFSWSGVMLATGVLELRGAGGTHDGTIVDGWYGQDGTHNGKPRYKHLRYRFVEIIWHHAKSVWWVHATTGYWRSSGCYYFNRQQTDEPPTDGWEVHFVKPALHMRPMGAYPPAPTLTWAAGGRREKSN